MSDSGLSQTLMAEIRACAEHLNAGGCVAMPTETVYGLAARVDSPAALAAVFQLKRRPSFDPLIVHIENFEQVHSLAEDWPETAASLARCFWPGPLTIVVKKKAHVNSMITAGLETVGLRMPSHPVALALLKAVGAPLAAPSANRFGRTSPTSAAHVHFEFPEAIRSGEILVLDGGNSAIGVESTVCLVTDDEVSILRPGGVTEEELRTHFKASANSALRGVHITKAIDHHASPGHTEHHYETKKPLIVSWNVAPDSARASYTIMGREYPTTRVRELRLPPEPTLAARHLYALLRAGDQDLESDALLIYRDLTEPANRTGLWRAIDDRLSRAARLQWGTRPPADA